MIDTRTISKLGEFDGLDVQQRELDDLLISAENTMRRVHYQDSRGYKVVGQMLSFS